MKKDRCTIAREYVVSLFPAFQLVDSFSYGVKKIIGVGIKDFSAKFENNEVWWITSKKDWSEAHLAVVRKINKQNGWLDKVLKQIVTQGKKLISLSSKLSSGRLNQLSNKDLMKRYNAFVSGNIVMYNFGLVCPLIDYQDKQYFSDYIYKFLKARKISSLNEKFALLISSVRLWPDKQQEMELVRIYQKMIQVAGIRLCLKKEPTAAVLKLLSENHKHIYQALKKHTNKWAYLTYVYEGPAVGLDYYIDLIKDWLKFKKTPQSILKNIKTDRVKLIKNQKKLLQELNLSKSVKIIVKLAQKVAFVKPYRRLLQSQAYLNFEPILSELARRLNLSLAQVRFLLPKEIEKYLSGAPIDTTLINQRVSFSVYLNKNSQRNVLSGAAAVKHWQTVEKEKQNYNVKQISGTTAFPGKAKGRVVVINMPDDMKKMKVGNILVSSATSPNLMPAIRQAAAIVTDEGGITCHAAIVSRELKIPCVTGTKFVTKVFKDGDMVEVDANEAIVKFIK